MTDMELLREYAGFSGTPVEMRAVLFSSADHIEKLEDELHHCFHRINELQAALREIAEISDFRSTHPMSSEADYFRIARKALDAK